MTQNSSEDIDSETHDGSDEHNKYVFELQVWLSCATGGFLSLGVATAAFFVYWLLLALAGSVRIGGYLTIGVTIIATVLISKVVISRLWSYAVVSLIGLAKLFGTYLPNLSEISPEEAREKCHSTSIQEPLLFGIMAIMPTLFFRSFNWTCDTANPDGGLTNAVCSWFPDTVFLEAQLYVVRIIFAGFGVAGVFFSLVTIISTIQVYRGSKIQQAVRWLNQSFWVNPELDSDPADDGGNS